MQNVAQSIDKIAIGVVAVLILALCAWPTFLGGGSDHTASTNQYQQEISDKKDLPATASDVPDLRRALERELRVAEVGRQESWRWYRRPAPISLEKAVVLIPPRHEEACVLSVAPVRDAAARKVVHQVTAWAGPSEHVKNLRLVLEKQVEGEANWLLVSEFAARPGEERTVVVDDLEVWKSVLYRVRSIAESDTNVPLPAEQAERTSPASRPIPTPGDRTFKFTSGQLGRPGEEGLIPGRANLQVRWYDWAAGKEMTVTRVVPEAGLQEQPEQVSRVPDTDYYMSALYEGKDPDGRPTMFVDLRNVQKRVEKLTLPRGVEPPSLATDAWHNSACRARIEGGGADGTGGESPQNPAPPAGTDGGVERPEQPERPPSGGGGGGGLFGD